MSIRKIEVINDLKFLGLPLSGELLLSPYRSHSEVMVVTNSHYNLHQSE